MKKVFYFMGQLNDDDLEWMMKNGVKNKVVKGDILIAQFEPVDTMYIVLDGEFNVLFNNVVFAELGSGEIIGEMSFVDSSPPIASVIAKMDSHVVSIKKDAIHMKIKEDTGFASRFYYAISLFLVDRLRDRIRLFGYGNESVQHPNTPDSTEIDPIIMENLTAAGDRFQRMLQKFK